MAYTAEEINTRLLKLRSLRESGVLSIRHGDTSTVFRSGSELDAAIYDLEQQLGRLMTPRRKRIYYPWQSGKGY